MWAGIRTKKQAVTLVEVLIALAILSTLLLPVGMFLIEYMKGSTRLGDFNQVLNLLEERMEMALTQPYSRIPVGESTGRLLPGAQADVGIDLRPVPVGKEQVTFTLVVEVVPVEFAAAVDAGIGRLERVRLEESYKRLTLKAAWGADKPRSLDLVAYKADL